MPKAGLTAVRYRDQIIKVIHRVGVAKALAHKITGVVFSGPLSTYVGIIDYDRNGVRSEELAARLGGSRINDTWIAQQLDKRPLRDYFEKVYAPLVKDFKKLNDVRQAAYNTVWGGVSTLFAKLPFKEIATAVCGAAKKQVFYRYELSELVANPHIEVCNEIPMEAVRRMYNEVSKDEAFNLVCLSELRMAFRYASGAATRPIHAWQNFVDCTHFYVGERAATASMRKPLTVDQEQRKQKIVNEFGLESLFATPPASWGGPVTPAVSLLPMRRPMLAVA